MQKQGSKKSYINGLSHGLMLATLVGVSLFARAQYNGQIASVHQVIVKAPAVQRADFLTELTVGR